MNPAIDKSSSVDHVVSERKLRCKEPMFEPGGGGINVSRAVKKLGGASIALYPSGGPMGEIMEQLLDAEGVEQEIIKIENWTRENFLVYEETSGEQYRFGMPGAEMKKEEWENFLHKLENKDPVPDFIVVSGSLPPGVPADFYARTASIAKSRGSRLIVDTSGDALRAAADEGAFLIKPNMREFRTLTHQDIEDEAAMESAARDLIEKGKVERLVISLGAGGAMMITSEGSKFVRAPTVPIKSKVGAGDSMVAGIILALAREMSLKEALNFGVAAGAAAVMTPGSELCRRSDTERIFKKMS